MYFNHMQALLLSGSMSINSVSISSVSTNCRVGITVTVTIIIIVIITIVATKDQAHFLIALSQFTLTIDGSADNFMNL